MRTPSFDVKILVEKVALYVDIYGKRTCFIDIPDTFQSEIVFH